MGAANGGAVAGGHRPAARSGEMIRAGGTMEERFAGASGESVAPARPDLLVAELTHRCPLGCPYCCNPLALEPRADELDAVTWARVFAEAAALGVRAVHLSGGEPGARRDVVEIAASAREAGLDTGLVTSGVGITTRTMRDLWEAGLHRVAVSFQDADAVAADGVAGERGAFHRKYALAVEAVRLGLPLTVGVVLHRDNVESIAAMAELALELKAARIEFAHVRYQGWALKNRAALMPAKAQLERAKAQIEELQHALDGRLAVDVIAPDAGCYDERDRRILTVTPSGRALPCPAAEANPGLAIWNVREHCLADIWAASPAFKAFRDNGFPAALDGGRRSDGPAAGGGAQPYLYRRM
jgi:pyrroloquinoline quinone biosynthesis protein E